MRSAAHRILVVDDVAASLDSWKQVFSAEGYDVDVVSGAAPALTHLRRAPVDLVLSDVRIDQDTEGIDLLRTVKAEFPSTPVLLYTGCGNPELEAIAMSLGAADFFSLPVSSIIVVNAVRAALKGLRTAVGGSATSRSLGSEPIAAESPSMKGIVRWIHRVAATDSNVLITGETGTGKELVAHAVHAGSTRAPRLFVAVNCGAIPAGFAEAEFFGYRKGAFTSAMAEKAGLLEEAHRGTLFLDEVGELPLGMQALLLRFLDSGEFRRLGENKVRHADVRVIAATNRALEAHAATGLFRRDLYYRLNVASCHIPPLRDRPEDIEALVNRWCSHRGEGGHVRVTPTAMARLLAHRWPGNVRELRNALERSMLASYSHSIDEKAVDVALADGLPIGPAVAVSDSENDERARLLRALETHRWHIGRTAESLGVSRWTLRRRLRGLGLVR